MNGLMSFLFTVIFLGTKMCTTLENQSLETPQPRLYEILYEYLKYNGVLTLDVIKCPLNESAFPQLDIEELIIFFMRQNVPVRVWSGVDYLEELYDSSTYGSRNEFQRNESSARSNLKLKFEPSTHKTGIILEDFSSTCGLNVLSWCAAPENNYYTTNRFWLLLSNNFDDLTALECNDIFLPPDSEIKVLVQSGLWTDASYSLLDIYKVSPNHRLTKREVILNFTEISAMIKALRDYGSPISYRENLDGITFKTGLVIAFPDMFTNIDDLSMRHIDIISKVNNRITLELANKLNMRFNTHQTDNYGWRQPNGSFDGLMGMFQRYELDFGQMAIFMRLDRIALCDFVAETFHVRAGIMFRQPPLSAVANIFGMPFDNDVWFSIVILAIFTIFIFIMELVFSPNIHGMTFWDACLFVWGAICQQDSGSYATVTNRSARIIVFTTFIATLFLFTSFSANIVALLQSPSEAIHTLSDLSQSPLEIGVQDTVYNKVYFNESTDPITNHLYHKKIAPKGESIYMRPMEGIEKMRNGLFAYQVELQAGYQIISDTFSEPEKCGIKELEPFQLPMIAVPTRKNFPYKELFRRQLRWQREVGLMNREERKWFPQKPQCDGGFGGFVSINLTDCRYALGIFGFGLLSALAFLCCEMFFKYSLESLKKSKKIICITE